MNPGTHALNWCGMSLWKEKYGLRDQVGLTLSLSDGPRDTYIPRGPKKRFADSCRTFSTAHVSSASGTVPGSVTVLLRPGRNRHDGHLLATRNHE